ncbi:velvet factor-domain-containing protein [Chaetomidium leptoderma]|uniref:Velvet factor-domain-containing protein n=1 Tax=Chaetomidium leptoderma TaxID=669021 RepID=A0AAN6VS63_9PEZI|nr:velvet factor-domain-containing protein [Chaetomidium leptoderma]
MGAPILASAAHAIPALETGGHAMDASITSRDTRSGRRLWYRLKVIQQPERARACGSGPKSSADRRPVDPPPVVELRIYEGQTWEMAQEKDITFVYNANFFLFATLEHARIMAHARGSAAPSNTPPVLTGMPVSGMAYLDRPQEAGYFLFPDLSVRHEGRYKLTFNLYEETKEDKDKEREGESQPPVPGLNPATGGSFDFRMEVKSQEFIVYSAKKFPGLAESTALSRVVAEQGCRVRIRRDVRMRRRDGKGAGDYDNAEDEYARRRRTPTPDNRNDYNNRARSMSGSTERAPYSADPQRRPSMADYQSQYPQNPPPGGHLQFLGGNASSQYPAAPPQPFAQPPSSSVPASPVYPPSQSAAYPMPSSYAPPPPPPPAPKSHSRERTPSQSAYAPINPAPPRRDSVQHDYRPSGPVQLPPLPAPLYHPPTPQQSSHMPPPPQQSQVLPPLNMDNSIMPAAGRLPMPMPSPTMLASTPRQLVPLAPLVSGSLKSGINGPIHPATLPPPMQYAGSKRAHDQSFRQESDQPRFQDGAREKATAVDIAETELSMPFHRADGTKYDALHLQHQMGC